MKTERCICEPRSAKEGRQPPAVGGGTTEPSRGPAECPWLCRHLDFELFIRLLALRFKNMHQNTKTNVIIIGLSRIHSNLDTENIHNFPNDFTILSVFKLLNSDYGFSKLRTLSQDSRLLSRTSGSGGELGKGFHL